MSLCFFLNCGRGPYSSSMTTYWLFPELPFTSYSLPQMMELCSVVMEKALDKESKWTLSEMFCAISKEQVFTH